MSVMAVQSVRSVTAVMLLRLFFLSGAVADCGKDPALFIDTPKEIKALNGSCLHIPCNFSAKPQKDFNSARITFGVWMKDTVDFANNPDDVVFNSSRKDNIYPMTLTGDLSQNNCTTSFSSLMTSYTGQYFFRVENKPFIATASCNPLQITVTDSAPKPRIEIPAALKEKESVSVSCSASTPCPHSPPKLTWNLQQDAPAMMEENTDRTFTTKIQKIMALSEEHDGFTITCSASYPVNEGTDKKTAEETTTLKVSYAPKDTSASISPSGPVSAGSWVNLTCSSRANPPVSRFLWFKNSLDGPVTVFQGDFYRFNVTDGGVYYCVATNQLGNQSSSEIHLTIEVGNPQLLAAVLGGIIGIIVLIGFLFCFWRLKATHPTAQQSQNPIIEETREDDIHYGEINFSRRGPEPASVQNSGQQQETLYAQVNVSKTVKSSTADATEDLYAQVKRK
ncbi:sialic acid-binding Ig-like lectin 13 isoform X2 [Pseudoliparis swirei]|uniref:sialic acid-binding Ig-like lectin 13 isoform X2 n=1 Tax=Pseudoliparis swirei TaxID=2059687 RepID=UPI0024BE8D61|nr:sialic acid-binding Ig-like lectin 13 isoform X2 [Pseudoliparis swirei]